MNLPPLLLLLPIPDNRSPNTSQLPLCAITRPLPQVLQLPLRLRLLPRSILLDALPAQILVTDEVADRLLRRADGLVPRARCAG